MNHNSHILLWRLWNEYQSRPIEQIKMFHHWVDKQLGNVGLDRIAKNG